MPPSRPGPPLGVAAGVSYVTSGVDLEPGDRIVLYTDGLIERRGESLTVGIERLERSVDDSRSMEPQRCTEFLSGDLSPREDDVAVLLVEIAPATDS